MVAARTLSILIVEDNSDIAETTAALLELHGHTARTAQSGAEALRMAGESPPEVVILDIGLPGMDGFTLAGELVAMLERRPLIVVISGYTNLRTECLAAGCDHYFVKPVEPAVLDRTLKEYAEKLDQVDSRRGQAENQPCQQTSAPRRLP